MTSRETLHDKSTRVFPDGKKFLTNTINTEENSGAAEPGPQLDGGVKEIAFQLQYER
jgi:hypothetical protein